MDRGDKTALTAFVIAVIFGGGNAVAIKFSVLELDPIWAAALRFLGAAAIMLVILAVRRESFPRGRSLITAIVFGILTFGIAFALGFYALVELNPGFAQIIFAILPLFTLLFAVAHGQEKITAKALGGSALALAGIGVMSGFAVGDGIPLLPLLALLGGVLCIAEAGVLVKSLPHIHPVAVNAVGMSAGAVFLLGLTFVVGNDIALPTLTETWVAMIYMVVASVIIFTAYLLVLEYWSASRASYIVLLMPPITIVLSVLLLDEPIGPGFIAGGLLVLAGVYVGAIKHTHHRHHHHLHA